VTSQTKFITIYLCIDHDVLQLAGVSLVASGLSNTAEWMALTPNLSGHVAAGTGDPPTR
jgi:hypothetical protein